MEAPAKTRTNLSANEKLVIDEFSSRLRKKLPGKVQRVILYGSRARGDAEADSDYDFLALLEPCCSEDERLVDEVSWAVSQKHNVVVVAFTVRASEFTEDRFFYFYENVSKEGVDL